MVNSVKMDAQYWLSILSIGYFDHQKDGAITRSATQPQYLELITICWVTKSHEIQFCNPVTRSVYKTNDYKLYPGRQIKTKSEPTTMEEYLWAPTAHTPTQLQNPTPQERRYATTPHILNQ